MFNFKNPLKISNKKERFFVFLADERIARHAGLRDKYFSQTTTNVNGRLLFWGVFGAALVGLVATTFLEPTGLGIILPISLFGFSILGLRMLRLRAGELPDTNSHAKLKAQLLALTSDHTWLTPLLAEALPDIQSNRLSRLWYQKLFSLFKQATGERALLRDKEALLEKNKTDENFSRFVDQTETLREEQRNMVVHFVRQMTNTQIKTPNLAGGGDETVSVVSNSEEHDDDVVSVDATGRDERTDPLRWKM